MSKTVGVVGTGVIGASWTGLFLARGLRVLVADPGPDAGAKLREYLTGIWPALEKIGLAEGASLSNYRFVGESLKDHYGELDFVQENAPEKIELKTKLLGEIDAATRPEVVIASSSSGIPSSQFIEQCKNNPGRVLIGHPFNPPHLMPLVEVVPHPKTDSTSVTEALDFYRSLGKSPVLIRKEIPGFAANRLQIALCYEAYSLVNRGIMSAQDVDTCVTASLGPRWALQGPYMANAMGGGGGTQGFRHLLEHLGPGTQRWIEDMKEHAFSINAETMDRLSASVTEELDGQDMKALEQERDKKLIEVIKLKNTSYK